jgi:hypothetical protein
MDYTMFEVIPYPSINKSDMKKYDIKLGDSEWPPQFHWGPIALNWGMDFSKKSNAKVDTGVVSLSIRMGPKGVVPDPERGEGYFKLQTESGKLVDLKPNEDICFRRAYLIENHVKKQMIDKKVKFTDFKGLLRPDKNGHYYISGKLREHKFTPEELQADKNKDKNNWFDVDFEYGCKKFVRPEHAALMIPGTKAMTFESAQKISKQSDIQPDTNLCSVWMTIDQGKGTYEASLKMNVVGMIFLKPGFAAGVSTGNPVSMDSQTDYSEYDFDPSEIARDRKFRKTGIRDEVPGSKRARTAEDGYEVVTGGHDPNDEEAMARAAFGDNNDEVEQALADGISEEEKQANELAMSHVVTTMKNKKKQRMVVADDDDGDDDGASE